MADPRARRRRLLSVLPRVFAAQPDGSTLGAVIEALATVLAELDEALLRTQRDHWVSLANGDAAGAEAISALERLGALLGVARLNEESSEAYRQRLLVTARILTRGLTTPRALLELAIATLGAEPCPHLQRDRDATLAFGLPLGTVSRCPVCPSSDRSVSCPNSEARVLEAWLTDNPPQRQQQVVQPNPIPGTRFTVDNPSLTDDVPELRLRSLDRATDYPYLQNRATGEILLYAGRIELGQVLSVWPQVEADEALRYESHDAVNAHDWRDRLPSGSAVIIDTDGQPQDVSANIYYLTGYRFVGEIVDSAALLDAPRYAALDATEGARFADALSHGNVFDEENTLFGDEVGTAGARFGSAGQRVRTPRLRPGADEWVFGNYTREDIQAVAGADPGELLDHAPLQAGDAPVELTLSWWARRPAAFRLSIPRNGWVGRAEGRDAHTALGRWVQQARAAGVFASIDFPEPRVRERQVLADRLGLHTRQQWRESLTASDTRLSWNIQAHNRESHALAEGTLAWLGVFDSTRLDASRFD